MRVVIELLRRFGSDERGVFAVLFGVMAIVLVATAGAVVDFTSIEQARSRAQQALDSAALGLQPTIYTAGVTPTTIQPQAQKLLTERLNDSSISATVGLPEISISQGTLKLSGTITVKTTFVQLVGFSSMTAKISSEATRKQLNLEVAMVLDNSGSMGGTSGRMTNLQLAARCATNILFNGDGVNCSTSTTLDAEDVKAATNLSTRISIVPFTEFVNVGTSNKTANWMDQLGTSKVARDGFDNDDNFSTPFIGNVNRFTLYSTLGITWKGCVEARNHTQDAFLNYYDTSDSPPDISVPDSLFVPTFAPDQPSGYANDYISDTPLACGTEPTWVWTQEKGGCSKGATGKNAAANFDSCTGTPVNTYLQTVKGVTTSSASTPPAQLDGINAPTTYVETYSTTGSGSNIKNFRVRTYTYPLPVLADRVLQERLCKYVSGATVASLSSGPGGRTGPNADCPATALLPLTGGASKSTIIGRIKAMAASGGTNIHQGVMWGFHALSPSEPLTEAKPYDSATSKAMIVMTDGENTHSRTTDFAGANWYTAYGYPYNGRLTGTTTALLQTEMDNRTKTTCANAKAVGITVYTIGLSPPNQSTIDMLTACASTADKAYFPSKPTDLVTVFRDIANKLATLRLAK